MNFSQIIEKCVLKENLTEQEAFSAMKEILSGNVPQVQVAGFLTSLHTKGETADEIVGFVKAMRESMTRVKFDGKVVMDTCGTGGDGKCTFNISTASAFVVAGAGVPVAKHGNRSVSSNCGSADVLEACGVKIDMNKEAAEKALMETGITFLLAPLYHPAMKNVAIVRKELGVRTVFNFLGPLVNPASANVQVIGVPGKELMRLIAKALQKLNGNVRECSLVVHESGYDEIVLLGESDYCNVFKGEIKEGRFSPDDFGMKAADPEKLKGINARENSVILRNVLSGKEKSLGDVVTANAALGLLCAAKVLGQNIDLKDAVKKARESLAGGAALKKLDNLIEWSNKG